MTCKSSWLVTNQDICCAHTLLPKSYQVRDHIVALFLQPDQNTGRVQSTAVGQNHCTFRHDEGCSVQQEEELRGGSREETAGR